MSSAKLANTSRDVTRIVDGAAPPILPDILRGDTRLTGRWTSPPFSCFAPSRSHHCIARHVGGHSSTWAKIGGKIRTAAMVPGTITIVPKGRDAWRHSNGSIELSSVFLGNDRLYAAADQVAHGQRPELFERVGFDDPRLFGILGLLSDEAQSADPNSKLFLEQLIDLLCLQLLRAHSSLATPLQAPSRRGLAAWQVKRVTDYMREKLDQHIELQELADLVGLSRYHFCHAFRRASGHTPHGWLTSQRIARARELLASPQLRIVEVALAVGYQTPSAFALSFRRLVGKTPTEYRRAHCATSWSTYA